MKPLVPKEREALVQAMRRDRYMRSMSTQWEQACKRLGECRRVLAEVRAAPDVLRTRRADVRHWAREEERANTRVGSLEREIARRVWQLLFNEGRGILPIRPKFARARRTKE